MTATHQKIILVSNENENHKYGKNKETIESSLDFILTHFEEPIIYPRTISTFKTGNKQIIVRNKQEILQHYEESSFKDCRVSVFPSIKENVKWESNFIFIDLDRCDFSSEKTLNVCLARTLKSINENLGVEAHPTVLHTGGGYHIYQPVKGIILENIAEFNRLVNNYNIFNEFLRFSKSLLSDNKADRSHNPSLKSCLVRIPGSINSKYNIPIRTIQKWNGYKLRIGKDLLLGFNRYLIQKKIDDNNYRQKILIQQEIRRKQQREPGNHTNYYQWIDQLLQVGVEDCRKLILDLILAPYLINVKKLSFETSYEIIRKWLDKCDNVKKLDNPINFNRRILYALKNSASKQYGPMSRDKMKTDNIYLKVYTLLKDKGIMNSNSTHVLEER